MEEVNQCLLGKVFLPDLRKKKKRQGKTALPDIYIYQVIQGCSAQCYNRILGPREGKHNGERQHTQRGRVAGCWAPPSHQKCPVSRLLIMWENQWPHYLGHLRYRILFPAAECTLYNMLMFKVFIVLHPSSFTVFSAAKCTKSAPERHTARSPGQNINTQERKDLGNINISSIFFLCCLVPQAKGPQLPPAPWRYSGPAGRCCWEAETQPYYQNENHPVKLESCFI